MHTSDYQRDTSERAIQKVAVGLRQPPTVYDQTQLILFTTLPEYGSPEVAILLPARWIAKRKERDTQETPVT